MSHDTPLLQSETSGKRITGDLTMPSIGTCLSYLAVTDSNITKGGILITIIHEVYLACEQAPVAG